MNKEELRYVRKIWRAIKYRTRPSYFQSHLYYDKGVKVCNEWLTNYKSFEEWALINGLKKGTHIDRIDSNGNYDPFNCRVVTPVENANNRENTLFVVYKGNEYAIMNLLRDKGLINNEGAIRRRIKRGWSVERAFDTPIRVGNYQNRWK